MGNLRIDKANNKVFAKGKEINLSKKEFEVLWLLASQPSKTFSSEDIINAIMESGMMIQEKQFIDMLTQNICKKAGMPFIQKLKENNFQFRNKYFDDNEIYIP